MERQSTPAAVAWYLRHVAGLLADLPDDQQQQVLAEIAGQLDDAYRHQFPPGSTPTAVDIADMLADFGPPEAAAAAMLAELPDAEHRRSRVRKVMILGGVAVLAAGALATGVLTAVAGPSGHPPRHPAVHQPAPSLLPLPAAPSSSGGLPNRTSVP